MGRENATDRRLNRAQRQEKKETKEKKKAAKEKSAEERARAAAEEEDLDAIIAQFEKESKARTKVEVEVCEKPPKPRINFTFAAHPMKDELMLFGGEYFDGQHQYVYGDFFIFNLKKNEWRHLISPNSPPPRCGHAAAVRARGGGELWIFGGEYASKTQERFKHYNDLWVFYLQENAWEKVEAPNGPTARSGHRMAIAGSHLVVFGGFYDNAKGAPKYFNDVYTFHLEDRVWTKVTFPTVMVGPTPRSACQMMPVADDKILIFGGYSRQRVKGELDKGETHGDVWQLELEAGESSSDGKAALPRWKWTRVRPGGVVPSVRSGAVMVARPGTKLLYSFGGVADVETEDALQGSFMNDLFCYGIDTEKWSTVSTKAGMVTKSDQEEIEQEKREKLKRELLIKKLAKKALKAGKVGKPLKLSSMVRATDEGPSQKDKANEPPPPKRVGDGVWPRPRANVGLTVKGRTLYLYGGYYEMGDKQVTLADLYFIDLGKLDAWELIQDTVQDQEWLEEDLSSTDEEEEGEESD